MSDNERVLVTLDTFDWTKCGMAYGKAALLNDYPHWWDNLWGEHSRAWELFYRVNEEAGFPDSRVPVGVGGIDSPLFRASRQTFDFYFKVGYREADVPRLRDSRLEAIQMTVLDMRGGRMKYGLRGAYNELYYVYFGTLDMPVPAKESISDFLSSPSPIMKTEVKTCHYFSFAGRFACGPYDTQQEALDAMRLYAFRTWALDEPRPIK